MPAGAELINAARVLAALMMLALGKLMGRLGMLQRNIESLSPGDADLTRRIPVRGKSAAWR